MKKKKTIAVVSHTFVYVVYVIKSVRTKPVIVRICSTVVEW